MVGIRQLIPEQILDFFKHEQTQLYCLRTITDEIRHRIGTYDYVQMRLCMLTTYLCGNTLIFDFKKTDVRTWGLRLDPKAETRAPIELKARELLLRNRSGC